ncbi:putative Uridine-cytidine kinase protein, partial [Naja naja]
QGRCRQCQNARHASAFSRQAVRLQAEDWRERVGDGVRGRRGRGSGSGCAAQQFFLSTLEGEPRMCPETGHDRMARIAGGLDEVQKLHRLCGGSASGKTTVANKIIEALDVPWVVLLSMDSFYKVGWLKYLGPTPSTPPFLKAEMGRSEKIEV